MLIGGVCVCVCVWQAAWLETRKAVQGEAAMKRIQTLFQRILQSVAMLHSCGVVGATSQISVAPEHTHTSAHGGGYPLSPEPELGGSEAEENVHVWEVYTLQVVQQNLVTLHYRYFGIFWYICTGYMKYHI